MQEEKEKGSRKKSRNSLLTLENQLRVTRVGRGKGDIGDED